MKIGYLYTALLTMGGADKVITQKANYLAENMGYEVYLITDSQAGKPTKFPLSTKVKHIDLGINFDTQYKLPIYLRFFYYKYLMQRYKVQLESLLNELHLDVVITTLGRDMDFLTSLTDGSKKVGELHIAKKFMRNFHLLEARGGIYKITANYWRRKQEEKIDKLDALVVLTKAEKENWKHSKRVVIIPNPLTILPKNVETRESSSVISVGRFTEQKGYDLLIESWKKVHKLHGDWKLNIYGEGELNEELQKQINKENLTEQITLHPPTSHISEKYSENAFYVMSSRFEGFGLVLTEAMSCGLPCISFDCPHGPSEIIQNKVDGILIENGNVEKMGEAICYLIENREKREEMGKVARINSERYSEKSIMKQWEALFHSLNPSS
ncbi:MAG: glycosyltransferase family 4 protein [Phocaeicola sp.]